MMVPFSTFNQTHFITRRATLVDLGRVLHGQESLSWAYQAHAFKETIPIPEIIDRYAYIPLGAKEESLRVRVAGRISSVRHAGKKLIFIDIEQINDTGRVKLQLFCSSAVISGRDFLLVQNLCKGDIIGVEGAPGRTKAGELSIYPSQVELLSPCLHQIPDVLEDPQVKARERVLDLMIHDQVLKNIHVRSKVLNKLRQVLLRQGYVEAETPILWNQSGGAIASAFKTESKALGTQLKMRIAPELFLKQLIIARLDKVFEIGKVFRNEGLDSTHNIEFTMCEIYTSYQDYNFLFDFTEMICREIAQTHGSSLFDKPFNRIEVIPFLNRLLVESGSLLSIPEDDSLNNEGSTRSLLIEVCTTLKVSPIPSDASCAQLFDLLISELIEPLCIEPTFIMHHPVCLSPLAKAHVSKKGVAERFELFVRGLELVNAYSELNEPDVQRQRFQEQAQRKAQRFQATQQEEEEHVADESYCRNLELGLPPTAGWGMGIDRMCLLLTECRHIRDVLAFPVVKSQH